jgi:hypothetical protein
MKLVSQNNTSIVSQLVVCRKDQLALENRFKEFYAAMILTGGHFAGLCSGKQMLFGLKIIGFLGPRWAFFRGKQALCVLPKLHRIF